MYGNDHARMHVRCQPGTGACTVRLRCTELLCRSRHVPLVSSHTGPVGAQADKGAGLANGTEVGGHVDGLGATLRSDKWWVGPALTVAGLTLWLVYYSWAALQGEYYAVGPYLSPFYAPLLWVPPPGTLEMVASPEHAFFGQWDGWPWWLPGSPALFIFIFPATFRATCYYYRKAYYRSFFGMPPGCAVGGIGHDYQGETGLLVVQNLHRYTLYFAILLLPFLFLEAYNGFWHDEVFGVGLGGMFILINALLLTGYTLGCHAWRHLIGGKLNCFSCDGISEARHGAWTWTSWLNARHMKFAWTSLYWILLTDVYIRLMSMGVVPDINTWNGITYVAEWGGH